MKKLMRKLSRVSHSAQYSILRPESPKSCRPNSPKSSCFGSANVPTGHFPVYVGLDETQRFIVNAEMLHHPIFVELLNKSAQEYGYEQRGVLRIPVNIVVFKRVLESVRLGEPPACLEEVVKSVVSSSVEVR